jgi:hypothetical protein
MILRRAEIRDMSKVASVDSSLDKTLLDIIEQGNIQIISFSENAIQYRACCAQ